MDLILITEVIKLEKKHFNIKLISCILPISFLLLGFYCLTLPQHISVYENSIAHIGTGYEEESTAVIENTAVPVKENIEIDIVNGTNVSADDAGVYNAKFTFLGIPVKEVSLNVVPRTKLIPCGNISGVVIETKGVLVLGTGKVTDESGNEVSPCSGLIKSGDSVVSVNGKDVNSKEDFTKAVSESNGQNLYISVVRNGKRVDTTVTPVMSQSDGQYKIGCWVRDDTQGLGTLTFINPENNAFGALGHGIYDVDTNTLMNTSGGVMTLSDVTGVRKGEKGVPGEIEGSLNKDKIFGSVFSNTNAGIYGVITQKANLPLITDEAVETAISSDVHTGKAYIKSDVLGKSELYEVEIENINRLDISSDKSMTVKITDQRLLETTGGIVQGMSGSPILQDGKLIGALTHVFVNNPQKGYGIFIDNMLIKAEEAVAKN